MSCSQCTINVLAIIGIIFGVFGWFALLIHSFLWFLDIHMDFGEYAGDYKSILHLTTLNWFLPVVFLVATIISAIFEVFGEGNWLSSLFFILSFLALFSSMICHPTLIYFVNSKKCSDLVDNFPVDKMPEDFTYFIRNKTSGNGADFDSFLKSYNKNRICNAGFRHILLYGLENVALICVFIMIPIYPSTITY